MEIGYPAMTLTAFPIEAADNADTTSGERRRFRQALIGIVSSAALHFAGALLAGLALIGIFDLFWLPSNPAPRVLIVAGVEERVVPITVTMVVEQEFATERLIAGHVAQGSDWSFELIDEALLARDDAAPLPEDSIAAKWVEQATDQSRGASTDQNLDRLDELGGRLSTISSEQAIGDIGSVLSRTMNLGERATAPAIDATELKFESSSAQLHDVRLETDEATGAERYVATLVDRHGTAIEQEMDAESGKAAYDVMQTIKKYPLLESVYRAVVMKILDRLIEPVGASQGS